MVFFCRYPQNREPFDAELSEPLVGDYKLVGATCVGLASRRQGTYRLTFDISFIDEGGRSAVPELLIPLMRSRKAVIIGDHHQLPPTIASRLQESDAKEHMHFLEQTLLKTSFFEHLYESFPSLCRGVGLNNTAWSSPSAIWWRTCSTATAGSEACSMVSRNRAEFLDQAHPLRSNNVEAGLQEKEEGVGPSLFNRGEARALVDFLLSATRKLGHRKRHLGDSYLRRRVAVITPYGAQKRLIIGLPAKHSGIAEVMQVEVDTVDSSEAVKPTLCCTRPCARMAISASYWTVSVSMSLARVRENLVFFGSTRFLREREARGKKFLFSTIMERTKYDHGPSPSSGKLQAHRECQDFCVRVLETFPWRRSLPHAQG